MAAAPKYGARWPVYARQWDAMERTRLTELQRVARRLYGYKERYEGVVERIKKAAGAVDSPPWYWIACVHYRESDADFTTQLAQGDPLDRVSTHVPAGLGPYHGADAWERAALHILTLKNLHKVLDWRLEKQIYHWEAYNGWGYYYHNTPSAYVWSGSDQYKGGKYVADGVWSSSARDQQLGCAPLLRTLAELDDTIKFVRESEDDVKPEPEVPLITITIEPAGSARIVVIGGADDD